MTRTHTDAPATVLRIFEESAPERPLAVTSDAAEIAARLREIGVRFERWQAGEELPLAANQADVLQAYRESVDRLSREGGYANADVVRVARGIDTTALRTKFLEEHTHDEDEVRFFVEGRGAFYLHVERNVYQIVCVRGDLLSVPAMMPHWFDMGADPEFCVIRLFTDPKGWAADYTGDAIAGRFPQLDG